MAERSDKYHLYQESVQDVEAEIDFVDEVFTALRGRQARILREDFCGTANTSCEWVRRRPGNEAYGVDIDPEPLAWGREHNVIKLSGDARERLHLIQGDVLKSSTPPADILLAMNFSYYLFKTRSALRGYYETARANLADDGIFFLDAFGGYEAYQELKEPRKCDGFKYIWDQASYNPITGDITCRIHYRFPDASRMETAFEYNWRLWSLPELRELLSEAGFKEVDVYWEGTEEESGEGNGIFERTLQGDADAGWIAYLVARK